VAHRSVLLTRFIGLCIPRGARSCRCRGLFADVVVNQRPVATLAAVAAFALLIRVLMKGDVSGVAEGMQCNIMGATVRWSPAVRRFTW